MVPGPTRGEKRGDMKKLTGLAVAFVAGLVAVGLAVAGANSNWSQHAKGSMEVPVRDSQGQAQLILHLASNGSSLEYKLNASNIDNVFMAHIHMAPAGVNEGDDRGSTRRRRPYRVRSAVAGSIPARSPRARSRPRTSLGRSRGIRSPISLPP